MSFWSKKGKKSAPEASTERLKRDHRLATYIRGTLRTVNRTAIDVALVNISETGACVRSASFSGAGISIGDKVELSVPLRGINRAGLVMRCDSNEIGVEFVGVMTRVKLARENLIET